MSQENIGCAGSCALETMGNSSGMGIQPYPYPEAQVQVFLRLKEPIVTVLELLQDALKTLS